MPSSSPENFLDRSLLQQLAGLDGFARGEKVVAGGGVKQLHTWPDRASAKVVEMPPCRVKLWRARGELQWSCTCPEGREAAFCVHIVALGLAWLASVAGPGGVAPTAKEGDEGRRQRLQAHLKTIDPERLVALLLEATDYDEILRRRLLLESLGIARPRGKRRNRKAVREPDFAAYRELLREAIEVGDYVDYDAMPDYVQGVEEAVAPLGELLRLGHAAAVIELAEFVLMVLDASAEWLDGSDGSLNGVYDELQRLHHEACRMTKPDPELLAARLLTYELDGGLGIFNNAANNYAEVLGERGLRAWRNLLEGFWNEMAKPDLPLAGVRPIDHSRYHLQALMEGVAVAEGDVNRLIEIKGRDLSSPHDFLSLAELCWSVGRETEAVEWAERGLRAFPQLGDTVGLRDFGRRADAVRP